MFEIGGSRRKIVNKETQKGRKGWETSKYETSKHHFRTLSIKLHLYSTRRWFHCFILIRILETY